MRLRRQAGDPRITPEGRGILRRLTTGDLADTFAEALAESDKADLLIGGGAPTESRD
jgi:hypothetical protein